MPGDDDAVRGSVPDGCPAAKPSSRYPLDHGGEHEALVLHRQLPLRPGGLEVFHVGQVVDWAGASATALRSSNTCTGGVPFDLQELAGAVTARQGGQVGLDSFGVSDRDAC